MPSVQCPIATAACRFLLDDRGRSMILHEEWETLFPSYAVALKTLHNLTARNLQRVSQTKKVVEGRKKVATQWSDLAPHSPVSVQQAQLLHLQHLEALLQASMAECEAAARGADPAGGLPRSDVGEHEITQQASYRRVSVFVSSGASLSLSSVVGHLFSKPHLLALLRTCTASEHDLRRRERFAGLAEWTTAAAATGDSSRSAGLLSSMQSMRHFSPTRTRSAQHQLLLQQIVRDLSDATSHFGRRMSNLRKSVDVWVWEGYSGSAIGDRVSTFVDDTAADIREHYSNNSSGDSCESTDGGFPLPEDVLVAAVEDELYCYDGLMHSLHECLAEADDDSLVSQQMEQCCGASQASLHVPKMYTLHDAVVPYAEAIAVLRTVSLYRTPTRKLLAVKHAAKKLLTEMKRAAIANGVPPEKIIVGGDDFIPMFMYITLQSGIDGLCTQVAYLRHCLARSMRQGELGYYGTTLEFAAEFIKNMAASGGSSSGQSDARPSDDNDGFDRIEYLATPDHVFAGRWAKQGGLVRLVGTDNVFVPLGSGCLVAVAAHHKRNTPTSVCLSHAPVGDDSAKGESTASLQVRVSVVNLTDLSLVQKKALTDLFKELHIQLSACTTAAGKRVLVPHGGSDNDWVFLPAPPQSGDDDVHADIDRVYQTLWMHSLQQNVSCKEIVDAAAALDEARAPDWTLCVDFGRCPQRGRVQRVQELLWLCGLLPKALADGIPCEQFAAAVALWQARCSASSTLLASLASLSQRCVRCVVYLKREGFLPAAGSFTTQDVADAIAKRQVSLSWQPTGYLDDRVWGCVSNALPQPVVD